MLCQAARLPEIVSRRIAVRANGRKTTSASQSVRYLLSADHRLRKISLRKLRDRMDRAAPAAKPAPPVHAAVTRPPLAPPPRAYSWRAIVVGFTCVMAAAALMSARQPARDGAAASEPAAAAMVPAVTAPAVKAPVPAIAKEAAAPKPVPATAAKPVATPVANVAASMTPADEETAAMPVTITGCLEQDGDTFWLKNTSGADAPKARSWKTGFLRKRAARVELVDADEALRLSRHVGERVAAVGTLADRELTARSIQRVAATCK